jgi:ABC-type uncharacterized transport system permease subunit
MWTLESANFMWFYRESLTVGRFPPELYGKLVQGFFTFVMPVIVVISFPVKAMLNNLNVWWILFATLYTIFFVSLSLLSWKLSIKKYQSASS